LIEPNRTDCDIYFYYSYIANIFFLIPLSHHRINIR